MKKNMMESKFRLRLQYFAEGGEGGEGGTGEGGTGTEGGGENKPSIDDLMAQLAAEKAAREKDKAALDKALKEKGDLTKSLRAKQTAEEREAEERAEAEAKRQKEYEETLAELNQMKATQAYGGILADDKAVKAIIEAVADGDHKSIAAIIDNTVKAGVKAAQAEWLKQRPPVNAGVGKYAGMTMADAMKIEDRTERRKAIAEIMAGNE